MSKTTSNHSRTLETALEIIRPIDSKIGRKLRRAIREDDHLAILDLEINPSTYQNIDRFKADYLAVSLLSKFEGLDTCADLKAVAMGKFQESEGACKATNQRLTKLAMTSTPCLGYSADSLLEAARFKIMNLLGDFCWDGTFERMGFSSGASTRLRRREGDPYYKFQGKPDVTKNALPLAIAVIKSCPNWAASIDLGCQSDPSDWFNIVAGNHITTVAKNAKSDRCIAIEPEMNMFIQKGIGSVIRSKLKRVRIDLNNQSRNQELAFLGSSDNSLATIDLKAASDSVSVELVRWLMPPDWYDALMLARSPRGLLPDGELVTYEKISSMGNGYTFELESLIFWALSAAVVDTLSTKIQRLVCVYGDDIIVPRAASGFLIELLDFVGFKTNEEKTFLSGPFRESCGKHYFRGIDVTPFYIRKDPYRHVNSQYNLANSIRRWCSVGDVCDPRFKACYDHVVSTIRPNLRRFVPDGIGDVGLIGDLTEIQPSIVYTRSGRFSSQYRVKARLRLLGKDKPIDGNFALLRALHGLPEMNPWLNSREVYKVVTRNPSGPENQRSDRNNGHYQYLGSLQPTDHVIKESADGIQTSDTITYLKEQMQVVKSFSTNVSISSCEPGPSWA